MTQSPNYAELVAAFGRRIFGDSWAAPLARLANVNDRTVQRIASAAREGRDYRAARGVLGALAETLAPIALELEAFGRAPADTTYEMHLAGATVIEGFSPDALLRLPAAMDLADRVWRAMQLARRTRGKVEL